MMFKNVFKTLRYNLKTLIRFELLYKLITLVIFAPLFSMLFKLIMKINGFKYLTFENIGSFIRKPEVIILTIVLVLLMAIYTLFEINTILIINNASIQKKKINLNTALYISFDKLKKLIKKTRIGLVFLILFLIPFLNIGIATSYISVIKIPEFIMDYIKSNYLYFGLYVIIFLFLIYLLFRWIYTINYMVIDNESFSKARKKSIKLSKLKHIKDLLKILLTEALMYLSFIIFIGLGILIIILLHHYINATSIINSVLITIIWLFLSISLIIFSLLSVPIAYASITYLFYKHKEENNEDCKYIEFSENIEKTINPIRKNLIQKICFVLVVITIIAASIYTHGLIKGRYSFNISHSYKAEVTAHRGSSIKYPENTMLAFKGAKTDGAKWIELDVQTTKDNLIIVSHDSNLKRVSGINKNTWELTYDEIRKIDVANSKYKNVEIPLLEEVIEWASANNIKLNIEIKLTGHEKDIEKNIVDMVKNSNFEKNCIVTSGNYDVLTKIKKYSKEIKTLYVMSIAYGDILQLKDVDGYSVEATNVNKSMVKKIHKKGKEIHVWTINNEEDVLTMLKYNVDNIITDDVTMVNNVIKESQTSNVILDYINNIMKIFN